MLHRLLDNLLITSDPLDGLLTTLNSIIYYNSVKTLPSKLLEFENICIIRLYSTKQQVSKKPVLLYEILSLKKIRHHEH